MGNKTGSKVPHIRFKGFEGEWEEKEMGESTTTISNNTLSRANLNYRNGLAKNVHYGDVLIRFGEVLDVQNDVVPFISSDEIAKKLKSSALQNGDIVMADAAEDATVGKCTEIQNADGQDVVSGLHTIALRPLNRFAPSYLGYYLNSKSFHDQLLPIMQGTKVLSISKSAIKKTIVRFPAEESEQTKIGGYFREVDRLIGLHQQKQDKLETLKKAMLQKMFPQPGASTPEIRFKGFDGEWVERRLGEVATFSKGRGYSKNDLTATGTPIVLYGRLYTAYQTEISKVDTFVTEKKGSVKSTGKEVVVPASGESADDIARASAIVTPGILLGGDLNIVLPFEMLDSYFLALTLSNGKPQLDLAKRAQGKTVVHVRKGDLESVLILFPKPEEQQKIGAYFRTLDELISHHAVQLQKLKQLKSACLERMFV